MWKIVYIKRSEWQLCHICDKLSNVRIFRSLIGSNCSISGLWLVTYQIFILYALLYLSPAKSYFALSQPLFSSSLLLQSHLYTGRVDIHSTDASNKTFFLKLIFWNSAALKKELFTQQMSVCSTFLTTHFTPQNPKQICSLRAFYCKHCFSNTTDTGNLWYQLLMPHD